MIITGLRKFREDLSKNVKLVSRGEIVVIKDRKTPVAALCSISQLKDLANKAKEKTIISDLEKIDSGKNKGFLEKKEFIANTIQSFLEDAKKPPNTVPVSTIKKLETLSLMVANLISDEGTKKDESFLYIVLIEARKPISNVIENDYYHVTKNFLDKTRSELKILVNKSISGEKSPKTLTRDIKVLTDMANKAILREQSKEENIVSPFSSVLVREKKDEKYFSSKIYTLIPETFLNKKRKDYFIEDDSFLGKLLKDKKVGDTVKYKGGSLEILEIT